MPALVQAFTIAFCHACASGKDSAKNKTQVCKMLNWFTVVPPLNTNVLTDVATYWMKIITSVMSVENYYHKLVILDMSNLMYVM